MRLIAIALIAIILTGCAALPAPTPTPDAEAVFVALYEGLDVPYAAMMAQLDAPAWDDPAWRDELARLAEAWRTSIDALATTGQPAGTRWAKAWPVLQEALSEYDYAAGAIESAAEANEPALMEPARGRLLNGVNLMHEAMRILGGE